MTQPLIIQCYCCTHYHDDETCDAFPDGVPRRFLEGADHRQHQPGDRGIAFTPRPEWVGKLDAIFKLAYGEGND